MGRRTVGVDEYIKALPSSGIGNLLPKKICTTALAFVTVIACATSASAQLVPNKADSISASSERLGTRVVNSLLAN
jgi:hypothetical protein